KWDSNTVLFRQFARIPISAQAVIRRSHEILCSFQRQHRHFRDEGVNPTHTSCRIAANGALAAKASAA
ncbi:MAG: hypothetical protein K2X84_02755, partial [Beijerinckiaceae bacterium]|nr:hypothetical protein [Beijerinckiaceae bacterium]